MRILVAAAMLLCASFAQAQPAAQGRDVILQDTVTVIATTASRPVTQLGMIVGGVCVVDVQALAGAPASFTLFLQSVLTDGTVDDYATSTAIGATGKRIVSFSTTTAPLAEHAPRDATMGGGNNGTGPFGTTIRAKALLSGTTTSATYRVTCQLNVR